ncbi:MAG: Mov34/MPN/PAD-1 family protein [Planctomycetota bacterium]|nr:Mov34/MPN/PAD-1 family protein [Planctomycetota bacterium]
MTNDLDIQFGELAEAKPEVRLRPDGNKHFAVAPVYSPSKGELPVFVDLDAMRDMEEHAVSDTGVELGGVMLGGQYEDDQGRPFVLVTDSLRAKHYESTKGSFKFTHDTWSQITRERDEFPGELQMVGWYHTHPDWGVFLSGMDMFICDNFFNKKLDVALVIDPCRQDRGFFQWTGNAEQRVRRTDGFYLVASRFRQYELDEFATYLEGKVAMSGDPRFRGVSSSPAPIINVGGQPPWQTVAVLGMLTVQFCFLALIALRMLSPAEPRAESQPAKDVAALQASIERLGEVHRRESEIDAKIEVLDRVVGQWDGTPDGVLQSLSEKTSETKELREGLRAHEALERELDASVAELKSQLEDAKGRERSLEQEIAIFHAKSRDDQAVLADLEARLAALEKPKVTAAATSDVARESKWDWRWIAGIATTVVAALAVAAFAIPRRDRDNEVSSEESAEETNS